MSDKATSEDVPTGEVQDDSYVSRPGHKNEPVPVSSDAEVVEDPIDGESADSDAQLGEFQCHISTLGVVLC